MTEWQSLRKRVSRRRFLGYVAAGAGAAGLALACRREGAPEATPAPAAAPGRGQGGTLVLHTDGDPPSFDYYKTWGFRTNQIAGFAYPRLVKFKTGPGIDPLSYEAVPDLAITMPEQPDAVTYIFKLRPARWEDKPPLNGRPLTAEDVVKNFELFKAQHPQRATATDMLRVEAVASDTVRFVLSQPFAGFMATLARNATLNIMPYELLGSEQLQKDMWSAGRFVLRSYQVGSEVVLDYNPNYYEEGLPRPARLIFRIIPDVATTQSLLRTRQMDALTHAIMVSAADAATLKRDLPTASFTRFFRQVNDWLGFDLREAPFRDKRVRQAISMAVNRDQLASLGGEGRWTLPYGVLPQWYFDPAKNEFPNARYYQYNPQEARALLRAAGYETLGPYELIFLPDRFPEQRDYVALVQQQLRAVGVETNLKALPYAEFYSLAVTAARWEKGMAYSGNYTGSDPDEYFTLFWTVGSPRLVAPGLEPILREDTELARAIERQKRELDFNRRREFVREVVNIMADRMYNAPMVQPGAYHVSQDSIKEMHYIFHSGLEYVDAAYKVQ
jgi:peptide/nickel transport system substrate-binding protein